MATLRLLYQSIDASWHTEYHANQAALLRPDEQLQLADLHARLSTAQGAEYDAIERAYCGLAWSTDIADLRIALPSSATGCCDLVFTDPTYMLEGMLLFLARGLESLKPANSARLLCRPTRRSLPAAQSLKVDPRIYSQGRSAEETASAVLPAKAVDIVNRSLSEQAPARVLLVGDGWPTDMTSGMEITSLKGYLHTLYAFQQSKHSPYVGVVAVNLFPHYNAYLVRILLASVAKQLILAVADPVLGSLFNAQSGDPLRTLIESTYQLVARERGNARQPGVVLLQQVRPLDADGMGYLLRFLIDHPQARLANAWREGLIAWWTQQGRRLSKNQARRVIERRRLGRTHAHSYLSELSLRDLRALVVAVEQTLATLEKGNLEEEPE